ncbi:MAG: hypothetical protein Tp176DCM1853251_78 [Prokaryotic dsDNA virus sp.]|nr:MAG: hypothetical protein Tp176DCM1853251_78 [Prokaryotic dsDNA virus sp.]
MKALIVVTLALCLIGCAPSLSDSAICDGTRQDRKSHAGALIEDGGPVSQASGAVLLSRLRAGCSE